MKDLFQKFDFSDLSPIPQQKPTNPICPIAYPPDYEKLMDLFRAVYKLKEYSKRTLALTGTLVEMNPAHYTVWHFRQAVLQYLSNETKDESETVLLNELAFLNDFMMEHPKNYQLWQHRKFLLESLNEKDFNLDSEKSFLNSIFELDAKNYHAWSFRQWLVSKYKNALDGELAYTSQLIDDDLYNNSAWHYRFFLFFSTEQAQGALEQEFAYVCTQIEKALDNESSFYYLRGMLDKHPEVVPKALAYLLNLSHSKQSMPLFSLLFELYKSQKEYEKSINYLNQLIHTVDPFHSGLWKFKKFQFEALIQENK